MSQRRGRASPLSRAVPQTAPWTGSKPALTIPAPLRPPCSLLEPLTSSPSLRPADIPPLVSSPCFLSFANSFPPLGNPPRHPPPKPQTLGTPRPLDIIARGWGHLSSVASLKHVAMGPEVNSATKIRQQLTSVLSWSVPPTPPKPPPLSGSKAQRLTPTSQPHTDATVGSGCCSAFILSVTLPLLLLGRKSLRFAWLRLSHSDSVPFLTPLELRHLAVSKLSEQFMPLS